MKVSGIDNNLKNSTIKISAKKVDIIANKSSIFDWCVEFNIPSGHKRLKPLYMG